jgi:uncharacterized protein YjeT (DUF2065 family)
LIATIVLALGLVLVVEGLAFALAPSRIDEALDLLRRLPLDARRILGLAAVAAGVLLVWIARALGA